MWQFNWGIFWAVLTALALAKAAEYVFAIGFPLNVTLGMHDFQAIIGRLQAIESAIQERGQEDVNG